MNTTETIKSGSHNDHSRLAPSGSKTWTTCTQAPFFVEANQDTLMKTYVGRVSRLAPYLRSIPQEELKDHELEAMEIAELVKEGRLKTEDFTPEQRKAIKRTESSKPAREGTRAHDFAAAILAGQKSLEDIPEEFRQPVGDYVARCLAVVPAGETPMVEVEVTLFYDPKSTGTADFAVVTDDLVVVRDLKYGQGVLVSADANTQLAVYALSLMEEFSCLYAFHPATRVVLDIDMPRHHEAADAKSWELTFADLQTFCRDIHYAAIQIQERRGLRFNPSEGACQWCDGKYAGCKAYEDWSSEGCDLPDMDFEALVNLMPDLDKAEAKKPSGEKFDLMLGKMGLEPIAYERRVSWYRNMDRIISFLKTNEEALELEMLGGAEIDGVCLVLGREGNRAWANEDAADTFLKGQGMKQEERYDFKLKSPTAIEKALATKLKTVTRTANRFAELVTRSSPKRVLALADDKRPAVGSAIAAMPDLGTPDEPEFE